MVRRISSNPARSLSRKQFVKQNAKGVDVAARVNAQPAHLGLFGTHVSGRAHELLERREQRLVGELLFGGLGNAKINHLRHRHAVVHRDENVRGLDIAVNDSLLMRVLDGVADLGEEIQPLACGKIVLIAVIGDADAMHQFHDEVRPSAFRRARIENFGDVGMIHQRKRLPLGLEAGYDLFGVHTQLDDFERDTAAHRFLLVGHINDTAATFTDLLE